MEMLANIGFAVPIATLAGYLCARAGWLTAPRLAFFTSVVLTLFLPLLMFYTISRSVLAWESSGLVALGAMLSPVFCSLAAIPLARSRNVALRDRVLPFSFPNTGNLGIPLGTLLFGRAGMELSVIYSLVTAVMHYSYGVALVGARGSVYSGIKAVLQLPLFYASLAGFLLNGTAFPPALDTLLSTLALPALPCLLFLLGAGLHGTCLPCLRDAAWWAGWKYALGFCITGLFIALTGATGITAAILLLSAGFPSAVATIILTRRYEADHVFAGTMVALTTLLLPVTAGAARLLAHLLGFA